MAVRIRKVTPDFGGNKFINKRVSRHIDVLEFGQTTRQSTQKQQDIHAKEVRIDFSLKREVFFIIAGALMGGIAMAFPLTFL